MLGEWVEVNYHGGYFVFVDDKIEDVSESIQISLFSCS
jgi:hypothetical protein